MCGIAGFALPWPDQDSASETLAQALRNRGPDGTWVVERGGYKLVQTRLAIIDLSDRVVYPMGNETGDVWLSFNGEIYNHRALRQSLQASGHRFLTTCDAEVVVHGYEEWGISVFDRLNGMFAIAIVDDRNGQLVLARDRLGIKPLVRTTGRPFAFASDSLALVEAGLSSGSIDLAAVREFVTFHYIPPPRTGLADVRHVEPGTAIIRDTESGRETTDHWAAAHVHEPEPGDELTVEGLDQVLAETVERQLAADVEVGIFLSGGLDSSLLLAYARAADSSPPTFTMSFPHAGDYDEGPRAAAVAHFFGVPNHLEPFGSDFRRAMDEVSTAFDQPCADPSALPMLHVSQAARDHVTVALTGTGGDDLFAGYYRHRAHRVRRLLAPVPTWLVHLMPDPHVPPGAERRTKRSLFRSYVGRLVEAGWRSDEEQYLALIGGATAPEMYETLRFRLDPRVIRTDVALRRGLGISDSGSFLRRAQDLELATYVAGDLLPKDDRTSMAVGLEARVPLLDEEVFRYATRLPDSAKVSLFKGKIALRRVAERRLAGAPMSRVKRGFAVPLDALFAAGWRREAGEWFSTVTSDLVDPLAVRRAVAAGDASPVDAWAIGVLIGWETRLLRARREASIRHSLAGQAFAADRS
jgi:asparagine synthase (glutamine-hydrolysing)